MYSKKSVVFWAASTAIAVALAVSMAFSRGVDESLYKQGETYAKVYNLIRENYVEDVEREDLLDGALKGMVGATGDDYSMYFTSDEYVSFEKETRGKYVGVGIIIRQRDDGVTEVITPVRNSPAYRAGVRPGDIIEKVNGTLLKDFKGDVGKVISGEIGTKVKLTLISRGETEGHTLEIERAEVKLDYVTSGIVDEKNKTGYARLVKFSEDAGADLEKAIEGLQKQGMRGFILDLRDNGGGLLEQAIAVANLFIKEGVIVSTRGRTREASQVYNAKRKGTIFPDAKIPVVLLVNEASASASEIVAGALQDYGCAVIIGEKTFGKNSVQTIYNMEDGGALKLTVAYYFTPKGRSLKAKLMPDREVVIGDDEWIEVVERRNLHELDNGGKPYTGEDDTQLAAAIEHIEKKLEGQ